VTSHPATPTRRFRSSPAWTAWSRRRPLTEPPPRVDKRHL
jgi:hypothetical protein